MAIRSLPIAASLASAVIFLMTPSANATSCNTGPYIVFFDNDQAYVDEKSQKTLDIAANSAANCGYGKTLLAGHVDFSEQPELANKRLRAVRAYLVAHGIPIEDIELKSFGSARPRVPKGSTGSEPQNRRVEVLLSQPKRSVR